MRDMRKKTTVLWLVTMSAVLTFGVSAMGQQAAARQGNAGCTNQTLFGDYGVQIEGTLLAPNWPLRTLAMAHFDGHGNFTYVHYRVINGTPVTPDWVSDSGTYSVNADCTASAVFDGPIPVHLVVVNSGKDFRGIVDGDAITLVGSRVH
jgi:hypothetical protein